MIDSISKFRQMFYGRIQGSFASKMMKAMGWKPGDGLGKEANGMTAPIEVSMRSERAGLGNANDTVSAVPWGPAMKDTSKAKTRARYEDLEANLRQGQQQQLQQPPQQGAQQQELQEQSGGMPVVGREEGVGGLGLGM